MDLVKNSTPFSPGSIKKLLNWLTPIGLAILSTIVTIGLQRESLDRQLATQTLESDRLWVEREQRKLKAMQKLPPSGFGFNNLIADYAFISFLQYYGDDVARIEHQTGYGLSKEYFRIIVDRKPYFFNSHSYLASSVAILGGEPQTSIALMDRALEQLEPERFPLTYSLWQRKAIDEMLFLGDNRKAKESTQKAIAAIDRATFPPDAEEAIGRIKTILTQRVEFLAGDFDPVRVKRVGWFLILSNAPDLRIRRIAVAELQKLGESIEISPEGEIKHNPKS